MRRSDFEQAWQELSFEERAAVLRVIIEEDCIEAGVPLPSIRSLDYGMAAEKLNGEDYGLTTPSQNLVEIFAGSQMNGVKHFDDPWEAINTAYHEATHWIKLQEGSSDWDNEVTANSRAGVMTENYKAFVDDYGNAGPEQYNWPVLRD